jgi:hypothetical protein
MKYSFAFHVCAALLIAAALPQPAPAWGPEGHAMVGEIAERFLTPRTRERVKAILGKKQLDDYEVASWPDIIRGNKEYDVLYPQNSRWHYVDFDAFTRPAELQLPEDDQNIVGQIVAWHKELARPRLPRGRRLDALRFLVHFVGDVHQPLHCAYRYNDMGGNAIPVHSFRGAHFSIDADTPADHLPNLHSVWDECLVYELMDGTEPAALARQLADEITPEQQAQWTKSRPLDWALEGHTLAHDHAYHFTDGTDLPFTWSRPGIDLTRENYIDANLPVVREQLQKAGVRLAHLLNTALDRPRPDRQ